MDERARRERRYRQMVDYDPRHQFDERLGGLVMLGTIFFFTVTGIGVGAFFAQGVPGGLIGLAVGILLGLWVVPGLLREVPGRRGHGRRR